MVIKNRALFISDAHFNEIDIRFLAFIRSLEPSQIFFMGDTFNLFIPKIRSSQKAHKDSVRLINSLSSEVFYFCGNHDFGIEPEIFPHAKIFPREAQPAIFYLEDDAQFRIYLAHGDLFISKKYEIYIKLMNSNCMLSFLDALDFISFGVIYKTLKDSLQHKEIRSFEQKSISYEGKIISAQEIDERNGSSFEDRRKRAYLRSGIKDGLIIEGHFHRDYKLDMSCPLDSKNNLFYLGLPSLHCQKSVVMYENRYFKEIALKGL